MTFREYIGAIRKIDRTHSQTRIVADLFKEIGAIKEPEEDTIKSWLKNGSNRRNCRINDYFPNDQLEEDGFYRFFRRRVNKSWKKLQEAFSFKKDGDIIDLVTEKEDVFYNSLLRQFQMILGLPLSDVLIDENYFLLPNQEDTPTLSVGDLETEGFEAVIKSLSNSQDPALRLFSAQRLRENKWIKG